MTFPPTDGHLDDALSAYLDDELAPAARREVQVHLDACADCRAELAEISVARSAVRLMPVRAYSYRYIQVRPGRRAGAVWVTVAAAAAVVAFILPRDPQVAPALPAMVDSHAARASATGDPLTQLAPLAVPVMFGP